MFKAVLHGLKQLRQQGRNSKTYTEAGFFHPEVEQWQLLNPLSQQTRH